MTEPRETKPKYNFTLVEIRDSNKEFIYVAYMSSIPDEDIPVFIERVRIDLGYNPEGENYSCASSLGNVFSITTRKTTIHPINARYVHFVTGRYGLVGFGRKALFDQDKLLSQMKETDSRPHTIRSVQVNII
jgi:hypothetical protein